MLENVPGFVTSNRGADLKWTLFYLNKLGYLCDLILADARWFVPQSRPRLFIIGALGAATTIATPEVNRLRPSSVIRFIEANRDLSWQFTDIPEPPTGDYSLSEYVQHIPATDDMWWDVSRLGNFLASLSPLQSERLEILRKAPETHVSTAYRRTRQGKPTWEIRKDEISGCLRTSRGGSSKQALVEAGQGNVRVRWMTALEYARLQGAPYFSFYSDSANQARFDFGDAVCVPVVEWITLNLLKPKIRHKLETAAVTYTQLSKV